MLYYFRQEEDEKRRTRFPAPSPFFWNFLFLLLFLSLATRVLQKYLAPLSLSSGGRPREKPGEVHQDNLCQSG